MNYNAFTKAELVESIKYSGRCGFSNDNEHINRYLSTVWEKKTKALFDKISVLNENIYTAMKNGDIEELRKLRKERDRRNKQYDELIKAID